MFSIDVFHYFNGDNYLHYITKRRLSKRRSFPCLYTAHPTFRKHTLENRIIDCYKIVRYKKSRGKCLYKILLYSMYPQLIF